MITPKEYISDIIREGIRSAKQLQDDSLREKVTLLFQRLWDFIDDVNKLTRVLDLSRELSISVMEAQDFLDYEELEKTVSEICVKVEEM